MNDPLLTVSPAARFLGVSEASIHAWVKLGKLPCIFTTTGRRLFREGDLKAFAAKQEKAERTSPEAA